MMHELGDDRFGLQIVTSVGIVALGAHGAIEALHDTMRFWMPRPRFDVEPHRAFSRPHGKVRVHRTN